MNYPIPANTQEIIALGEKPVDEEIIAAAIAGVVSIARSQGKSLDQLKTEVLQEDPLLDKLQRSWLSDLVAQLWESIP